jgi:hypothetical protein
VFPLIQNLRSFGRVLGFVAHAALGGAALSACGDDPAAEVESEPAASNAQDAGRTADAGARDARVGDAGRDVPVDSGREPTEPGSSKSPFSGRYLIRIDTFGTASSSGFVIRSRASELVTAVLTGDADELDAQERVCDQVAEQVCKEGCVRATTVIDPRVVKDFMSKRTFPRRYTRDGATFRAEKATYLLGYDDTSEGALPTDYKSDARMWDVISGGVREGLLTTFRVETSLLPISCTLHGVTKFISSFSGAVEGDGADAKFTSDELEVNLDESDGKTLYANPEICGMQDSSSPVDRATVRILRVGDVPAQGETWDCPSNAEFEQKLPGGAL